MIILDATTKKLELLTSAAVSTDFEASYADITTTTFVAGESDGNVNTATTTDLVVAPAASTQRQVKYVCIRNRGTTAQVVTVKLDVSGTERYITPDVSLLGGECLYYVEGQGWFAVDALCRRKEVVGNTQGSTGNIFEFYKVGTAAEAVGAWYSFAKDTGSPGAWAPGAPGLAGRATDGTTAGDAGCLPIPNASSGANYLVGFTAARSVAGMTNLYDVLWVNTGLVVTTTTAQAFASAAFPARDQNGSTNGEGVYVGMLVTTATTNAGAITNTTMSYTNSDGTAGHTATMASFPATAVIGTLVWFQLQAGDKGVRSIQSVTLGTSRVAGALSLIAVRLLASAAGPIVNVGANAPIDPNTGVRMYDGTCALLLGLASATTATSISGSAVVSVR